LTPAGRGVERAKLSMKLPARLGLHHADRSPGERALAFDDPGATRAWDKAPRGQPFERAQLSMIYGVTLGAQELENSFE